MDASGSTPRLAELESWLVTVSCENAGVSAGIRRAAELHSVGVESVAELETLVTPGPHLSALERLAIYNDGYFARLVECLADDYQALAHALGAAEFERLARAYIALHPSGSPSLNAYGAGMASYLATRSEPWAPFAHDLARLEWALVEVIHAEVAERLEPDALARVRPEDWPRARLVASPALCVLAFSYPVNRFYQAFRDGGQPEMPQPEPSAVVVQRSGLSLYRLGLEPAMRLLLEPLVAGRTLGEALAALERGLSPAELLIAQARLAEWFGEWIASGFFSALELV